MIKFERPILALCSRTVPEVLEGANCPNKLCRFESLNDLVLRSAFLITYLIEIYKISDPI